MPDFYYALFDDKEFIFAAYHPVGVVRLCRESFKNWIGKINPQITYLLREDGRSEGFHPVSKAVFSSAYYSFVHNQKRREHKSVVVPQLPRCPCAPSIQPQKEEMR